MSKQIPDRWLPYSSVGSVIEGTRFICFKVPLKEKVLDDCVARGTMKANETWNIPMLLDIIPNLRYVIDLTNTTRYYDPKMFQDAGVEYVKIALPGRVIPPDNCVKTFCDTVDDFLQRDSDGLIGVHCTHGLNRTGYMVCRYLRDREGWSPSEAIKLFEEARGYKIERDNFLADLKHAIPPPPDFGQDTAIKIAGNPSQDVKLQKKKLPKQSEQSNYQRQEIRSNVHARDNNLQATTQQGVKYENNWRIQHQEVNNSYYEIEDHQNTYYNAREDGRAGTTQRGKKRHDNPQSYLRDHKEVYRDHVRKYHNAAGYSKRMERNQNGGTNDTRFDKYFKQANRYSRNDNDKFKKFVPKNKQSGNGRGRNNEFDYRFDY